MMSRSTSGELFLVALQSYLWFLQPMPVAFLKVLRFSAALLGHRQPLHLVLK